MERSSGSSPSRTRCAGPRRESLDLVEVGAGAEPPVCRILDWGKMKFEREKKARESRKKATTIDVKEVKYRPTIDTNDFDIKTSKARQFLSKGKKVKVTVFFRYRQLRRPELGTKILDQVTERLQDVANGRAPVAARGSPDDDGPGTVSAK